MLGQYASLLLSDWALIIFFFCCTQALDDDEMMRQYAKLLLRQDTARAEALRAFQDRTALRAEAAGTEVGFFDSKHSSLLVLVVCEAQVMSRQADVLCCL